MLLQVVVTWKLTLLSPPDIARMSPVIDQLACQTTSLKVFRICTEKYVEAGRVWNTEYNHGSTLYCLDMKVETGCQPSPYMKVIPQLHCTIVVISLPVIAGVSLKSGRVAQHHSTSGWYPLMWLMECTKNVKILWSFVKMDGNTTLLWISRETYAILIM